MVTIRDASPDDGGAIAAVSLSAAAYYAELDPVAFLIPSSQGLAQIFENVFSQPSASDIGCAERSRAATGYPVMPLAGSLR